MEEAGRLGVDKNRAVRFECDSFGTALNFDVMSKLVSCARKSSCVEEMTAMFDDDEMLAPIREDYARRHKT